MRDYLSSEVRNVALLGHSGVGKTALLESLLFYTKATDRFGKTSEGSSLIDVDSEEIKRGLSIYTTIVPMEWNDQKINFIDMPGYLDYIGEKEAGFAVADNILIVVDGSDPLQSGTQIAFRQAQASKKPTLFFINKLDQEEADFTEAYQQLHDSFGKSVIPFELPIIEEGQIVGSVNIIREKAWYYKGPKANDTVAQPVPEELAETVALYKEQIAEAVAMGDDALMEKFFSGEPFTDAELTKGVRIGVRNGEIVPVFSGSATQSIGVRRLMDLIEAYLPTYSEKGLYVAHTPEGQPVELLTSEQEVLTAQVFKTIMDPFVGRISYVKVLSGVLSSESTVTNGNNGQLEKLGAIYIIKGKHQTAAGKLFTGDIGAITKLAQTQTNDTLCEKGKALIADEIQFSAPMYGQAVQPKTKNDEDKLTTGLSRLAQEDPTFKVVNHPETHETLIYGVGDQHLDVILSKLKTKYRTEVSVSDPAVAYRETITKKAVGEGRHKKQSGGHGQFGHVFVEFEPVESDELVFEEKVFGGAIPKQYFPAVHTGLKECMEKGSLAGYRMVNVKATLLDGKYHDVDSSEMAFKLAAHLAFKDAMTKCRPILLEPIMNVKVQVPEEYTGTIIGDLNKRRGQIMGMEPDHLGGQVIEASVPLAEVAKYALELRSMTQGLGVFTMSMDHYDPLPEPLAKRIIETRAE